MTSRARQVLLAIISCMYIGACISQFVYIQKFILVIENLGGPPLPPIALGPQSEKIWLAIFTGINYLLSDGVVCWRAWVLYPQNKTAKGVLVLCMLSSVAALATGYAIGTNLQLVNFKASSTPILNLTYYMPLLFTNMVATMLVGAKFWVYRREIFDHLCSRQEKRKSVVNPVLILLTESGIVYCVFWIISVLSSASILGDNASEIFDCVLPQLPCIYLSIVICVSLKKSFEMTTIISGSTGSIETQFEAARVQSTSSISIHAPPRIGISFVDRVRKTSNWGSIDQVHVADSSE